MMDHVLIEKAQSIERCLARIAERYVRGITDLGTEFDSQDIIVLNLTRACQQAIDMANRVARLHRYPLPKDSADIFKVLAAKKVIDDDLAQSMVKMVGFRNRVIHEYQELDVRQLREIIETRLPGLLELSAALLRSPETP